MVCCSVGLPEGFVNDVVATFVNSGQVSAGSELVKGGVAPQPRWASWISSLWSRAGELERLSAPKSSTGSLVVFPRAGARNTCSLTTRPCGFDRSSGTVNVAHFRPGIADVAAAAHLVVT